MHAISKADAERCHQISMKNGFCEKPLDVVRSLTGIHSEVSEAYQAWRDIHDDQERLSGFALELADVCIRVFVLSERLGIDIIDAVKRKIEINASRPYKHGKRF